MFRCIHHATIDSTNLEALRAWPPEVSQSGKLQPLLISADMQTAGRGRTGRPWQSPAGGLWMTIAWPLAQQPDHYIALPLAVGLAVAKAVGRICRLDAAIKWPNDVLINGRKLCGILCQYEPSAAPAACGSANVPGVLIAGLGINGNYAAAELGNDLRQPATSLLDETGRATDLALLRNAIANQLAVTLRQYDADGLTPMLGEIRQRLAWRDQQVACDLPDGSTIAGRLIDVDAAGRLVIDADGEKLKLNVGDIRHLRTNHPTHARRNITNPPVHPVHASEFSTCPS